MTMRCPLCKAENGLDPMAEERGRCMACGATIRDFAERLELIEKALNGEAITTETKPFKQAKFYPDVEDQIKALDRGELPF